MELSDIVRAPDSMARKFRVLAANDESGANTLEQSLMDMSKSDRDGWIALLLRVIEHGPQRLNKNICHEIDKKNRIFRLRKRDFRIYFFYDRGSLVICSHLAPKHDDDVPPEDKKQATDFRDSYFKSKETGTLKVIDKS